MTCTFHSTRLISPTVFSSQVGDHDVFFSNTQPLRDGQNSSCHLPELWFAQADGRFRCRGIADENTKFDHVITSLDAIISSTDVSSGRFYWPFGGRNRIFPLKKPSGYIIQPSGYVGHFERCERELSRKNNAQNSLERGFLGRRVRNVPIGNFKLALNSATRFRGSCRTVFRSWLNFGHQLLPALMVKNFPLQLQYRGADQKPAPAPELRLQLRLKKLKSSDFSSG